MAYTSRYLHLCAYWRFKSRHIRSSMLCLETCELVVPRTVGCRCYKLYIAVTSYNIDSGDIAVNRSQPVTRAYGNQPSRRDSDVEIMAQTARVIREKTEPCPMYCFQP